MDYRYNGIIMGKTDVGETDRIYTILTLEEGKIRILGKGVRRPNARLAGHLEPITLSEILVARSKGIGKLTGSATVNNYSGIKSEIESLRSVSSAFNVLNKVLTDQEKDAATFDLTGKYLKALDVLSVDKRHEKKEILTLGFLFKLLIRLGYGIETSKCINCGNKLRSEGNYFSSKEGGILCDDCHGKEHQKIKIKGESIKFMRIFSKNEIENLPKLSASGENLRNLKVILDDFLEWIIK